jgi:hypothetical protein
VVADTEPNDTLATAQVLAASSFTLDADPNIFSSTTLPHVTITSLAEAQASFDFFRFETCAAGQIIVDVDSAPVVTSF